jgi:hypothetical protein
VSGITPWQLVSPSVPRRETRLAALDGPQRESPVGVPSAAAAMLVATETAEPLLDPIEAFEGSKAFQTCPYALALWKPELANSERLALPMMIAPASFSRRTRNALFGDVVFEHEAAARGRHFGRVVDVLGGDRDAEQRRGVARGAQFVVAARLGERVRVHGDERVEPERAFVVGGDPVEVGLDDLGRGGFTVLHRGDLFGDRLADHVVGRGRRRFRLFDHRRRRVGRHRGRALGQRVARFERFDRSFVPVEDRAQLAGGEAAQVGRRRQFGRLRLDRVFCDPRPRPSVT